MIFFKVVWGKEVAVEVEVKGDVPTSEDKAKGDVVGMTFRVLGLPNIMMIFLFNSDKPTRGMNSERAR